MDSEITSIIESEIKAFFEEYLMAFSQQDPDAVAQLWDEVGLFPSPTGNFSMERDAFKAHRAKLMQFYQKQGVTKPTGELMTIQLLFPNVVQSRMRYRMLNIDDMAVAEWEHVYILRKTNHWCISLAIADDEMRVWTEKGAVLQ